MSTTPTYTSGASLMEWRLAAIASARKRLYERYADQFAVVLATGLTPKQLYNLVAVALTADAATGVFPQGLTGEDWEMLLEQAQPGSGEEARALLLGMPRYLWPSMESLQADTGLVVTAPKAKVTQPQRANGSRNRDQAVVRTKHKTEDGELYVGEHEAQAIGSGQLHLKDVEVAHRLALRGNRFAHFSPAFIADLTPQFPNRDVKAAVAACCAHFLAQPESNRHQSGLPTLRNWLKNTPERRPLKATPAPAVKPANPSPEDWSYEY